MILRPYQQELFDDIHQSIRSGCRRIVVVSPTGSGKTATFCFIAHKASNASNHVLILVHRSELITQTSATLARYGVEHGIIQPGRTYEPHKHVQLAMVQTVCRRLAKITPPNLIITDECHHAVSSTYKNILSSFPSTYSIGFTATPLRLDGKGLGDCYDQMIQGKTVAWLIENGFLVAPRYYVLPQIANLKGIKTLGGDYKQDELADAMDKVAVTADAVVQYRKICNGSRAIAFCVKITHAQHVADQFNSGGIPAGVIHGGLSKQDRDDVLADFASGKVLVLTSVNVVSEGFDLPSAEAAILLRPTKSLAMHLQQIGRVLRPAADKSAYVLDHCGNLFKHGIAEDIRDWSLDGFTKTKQEAEISRHKQCPECFSLHPPAPICPECGHVCVPEDKPLDVVVDKGLDLIEFQQIQKKPLKDLLADVKSASDLKRIQKAKGYKSGWIWHMKKELKLAR